MFFLIICLLCYHQFVLPAAVADDVARVGAQQADDLGVYAAKKAERTAIKVGKIGIKNAQKIIARELEREAALAAMRNDTTLLERIQATARQLYDSLLSSQRSLGVNVVQPSIDIPTVRLLEQDMPVVQKAVNTSIAQYALGPDTHVDSATQELAQEAVQTVLETMDRQQNKEEQQSTPLHE